MHFLSIHSSKCRPYAWNEEGELDLKKYQSNKKASIDSHMLNSDARICIALGVGARHSAEGRDILRCTFISKLWQFVGPRSGRQGFDAKCYYLMIDN